MSKLELLPLILLFSGVLLGQGTAVDCTPNAYTITSSTPTAVISNANTSTPCIAWGISYNSTGFSAVSIQIETSPDNVSFTAVPNSICSSSVQPPCVIFGANPTTSTTNQTFAVLAYGRYVRLNPTVTGSGTITARVYGYKGLSAKATSTGRGGGGGGALTIAGTPSQITVTGAGCTPTNTGTCTISFPNASVTIDATTGSFGTPGSYVAGVGGPNSGAVFLRGVTDAKSQGFSVNDTAGVSILYLMPTSAGTAGQSLRDTGVVTCPTLATGAPTLCHQLAWVTLNYQTIDSNGTPVAQQPTVNFINGTNFSISCVNNSGANRTDCTGSASAGAAAPTFPVNAQTSTYQLLAADFSNCKTIAVASGSFTITAVASGSQPASGACVIIVNYGSGTLTFARSGQNINGAAADLTIAAGSSSAPNGLFVVSDGTNYIAQPLGGSGSTPGSGGLTLVEEHTASGSASLVFTTCISSTYDDYMIRFVSVLPATDAQNLLLQVPTDGGSTFDTSHYTTREFLYFTGGTQNNSGGTSGIFIGGTTSNAGNGVSASYNMAAPGSGNPKQFYGEWINQDSSVQPIGGIAWGVYTQNSTINAFRIIEASGNIASGTVRCYGLSK